MNAYSVVLGVRALAVNKVSPLDLLHCPSIQW